MPGFDDDDLFDDGGSGTGADDDGAPEKDPSTQDKSQKSTDKRVSDLQSLKDKETARANKAEKRLAALEAAMKGGDTEDSKDKGTALSSAADDGVLDMARLFAFQANPKLKDYGVAAADLNGNSPTEISQAAAELVARFEKIETQVRNKVLADQGLAPEVDSGTETKPSRDFSKMSSQDFNDLVERTLNH